MYLKDKRQSGEQDSSLIVFSLELENRCKCLRRFALRNARPSPVASFPLPLSPLPTYLQRESTLFQRSWWCLGIATRKDAGVSKKDEFVFGKMTGEAFYMAEEGKTENSLMSRVFLFFFFLCLKKKCTHSPLRFALHRKNSFLSCSCLPRSSLAQSLLLLLCTATNKQSNQRLHPPRQVPEQRLGLPEVAPAEEHGVVEDVVELVELPPPRESRSLREHGAVALPERRAEAGAPVSLLLF